MNQTSESTSETVAMVHFGVVTDEKIQKLTVVKITNRNILNLVGRPEPGGLCNPALGSSDDHSLCKTFGHRSFYCPGHGGHIDLVSLVYHPLLFDMLYRILQNICLACYHFKALPEEVEICICKLNLITQGDIVGAKDLDSNSNGYPDDSYKSLCGLFEGLKHRNWASFQLTEALSVLKSLLKKRSPKCNRCGAKNPPITKPTFGWFHMVHLSGDCNIQVYFPRDI